MIYIDYRGLCDIYNNVVEVSGGGASGVLDEGRIMGILEQVKNDVTVVKTSGIDDKLGSNRIQIWKVVIELIEKHPIFGVGTDNLKNGVGENLTETSIDFIQRAKGIMDKAHNEYLHIAVTIGIPALILYLTFKDKFIKLIFIIHIQRLF